MTEYRSSDLPANAGDTREMLADTRVDVPSYTDVLPDGRETVVIGDPLGDAGNTHRQGQNDFEFEGTCGLVSCEDVLRQFGVDVSETDVVRHALQKGLCSVSEDPAKAGGTSAEGRVEILRDFGVPAHLELRGDVQKLADNIERGHGVIAAVDAGVLWDDANYLAQDGGTNHAVVVTGVAREPGTGALQGFYINDSGTGKAAQFIDVKLMQEAWAAPGGTTTVTDDVRPSSGS
jgi:hypothetical protein